MQTGIAVTLPYHPPVTSYVLSIVYQIFGRPPEHLTALKIFLIVVSSISVVIFYRLARRYLSNRLALIAAVLFASAFPMLVISVTPSTEVFFLCFAMLTLLFFTRLKTSWKRSDAIWMGVSGALASLTRAEFASYFVVLAAGLLLFPRPGPRSPLPQRPGLNVDHRHTRFLASLYSMDPSQLFCSNRIQHKTF